MAKVMLVEDDLIMFDLLTTLLELEGFEVSSINKGEDFLESVRNNDPDVVLLDVHLRGASGTEVNGFDLLQQIRKDPCLTNSKVIMSSGIDFREKSTQEGANGFILKPYMPNDLVNLIRELSVSSQKRGAECS